MQITTAALIVNPCDDEYDNMALLCCHDEHGSLFSLTRFPDENEVEITVRDDQVLAVSTLKVTLEPGRLLVELDPADGKRLDGHGHYEILHDTFADELPEVDETLRIILKDVGTYSSLLG